MLGFFTQYKIAFYAAILAVIASIILGLSWEVHSLKKDNSILTTQVAQAVIVNKQQSQDLAVCSAATDKLKAQEDLISAQEDLAIAKAKAEALQDYKNSNTILFQKPVVPVITKDNAKDFGGTDNKAQIDDYLATQKLFNDYIDQYNAEKTPITMPTSTGAK